MEQVQEKPLDEYAERTLKVLKSAYPADFMKQIQRIDLPTWMYLRGMDEAAAFIWDGTTPLDSIVPKLMQDNTVKERAEAMRDKFPFDELAADTHKGYAEYHEGLNDVITYVLTGNPPEKYTK